MDYSTQVVVESNAIPGVSFTVARMSFARRIELMQQVRDLAQKVEYFQAGDDPKEKMEAALLTLEIDRLYVLWGLRSIQGLALDGEPATPETLIAKGPEHVFREALSAVRSQCGLTEDERKN